MTTPIKRLVKMKFPMKMKKMVNIRLAAPYSRTSSSSWSFTHPSTVTYTNSEYMDSSSVPQCLTSAFSPRPNT